MPRDIKIALVVLVVLVAVFGACPSILCSDDSAAETAERKRVQAEAQNAAAERYEAAEEEFRSQCRQALEGRSSTVKKLCGPDVPDCITRDVQACSTQTNRAEWAYCAMIPALTPLSAQRSTALERGDVRENGDGIPVISVIPAVPVEMRRNSDPKDTSVPYTIYVPFDSVASKEGERLNPLPAVPEILRRRRMFDERGVIGCNDVAQ